jgi:hypothetical protein
MKCVDDFRANQETYPEGFFGDGDDSKADSIKLLQLYKFTKEHKPILV